MNFRRFLERNCGQNNPIVDLASHRTQDNALQDQIGSTAASNQFPPQTFRMDDLMHEIENVEFQRSTIPAASSTATMDSIDGGNWATEYRNEFLQETDYRRRRITQDNASQDQLGLAAASNQFPPETFRMDDLMYEIENVEFQRNTIPAASSTAANWATEYRNEFLQETVYTNQEATENRDEQRGAFQQSFPHAETSQDKNEEFQSEFMMFEDIDQKIEIDQIQEEAEKKKKVFYFDGLSTEEAFNATAPDVEWSESENFCLFVSNYERKERQIFDLNLEKEFKFSENNPYLNIDYPLSQGVMNFRECNYPDAVLCYEAAVQKDEYSVTGWRRLIWSLYYNDQIYEAYYLLKKYCHLDPQSFSKSLFCLLIEEQYFYQGCQVILNWLRSHPKYYDIVPNNFIMEDKASNLIEEKQLKELQEIFIKAAQRYPHKLDRNIQIFLSILLGMSREYSKANDCWLALSENNQGRKNDEIVIGTYLLRNNKPHEAISILNKTDITDFPKHKTRRKRRLGLAYMYLREYKKAGQCLLTALASSRMFNNSIWIQLRLCTELMRRNDLRNLVENRNFYALAKEFEDQSTTTTRRARKRSYSI